jgi:hypothetical protein
MPWNNAQGCWHAIPQWDGAAIGFALVFIALKTAGMCCFTGADPAESSWFGFCIGACNPTDIFLRTKSPML